VARRVLAVLGLLAFGLAVGCGGQGPKAHRGPAVRTPRLAPVAEGSGRFVAIGNGRSLYMECVGSGSPAVVLEAGFGADTHSWQDVQPEVGRGTRTCSYDRAGTGNSVAPPGVRDARDEIADLRRLLARARVEPPYVLVGHSYGGVLARVFAHLYPSETAGLVLIDTVGRDGRRRQLAIWPRSQAPQIRHGLATTVMEGVNARHLERSSIDVELDDTRHSSAHQVGVAGDLDAARCIERDEPGELPEARQGAQQSPDEKHRDQRLAGRDERSRVSLYQRRR